MHNEYVLKNIVSYLSQISHFINNYHNLEVYIKHPYTILITIHKFIPLINQPASQPTNQPLPLSKYYSLSAV